MNPIRRSKWIDWRMLPAALLLLAAAPLAALNLPGPLVEPEWLAQHLDQVVVLDVRSDADSFTRQARLGRNQKTGRLRMLQMGAHIPGARLVPFKWVTAPAYVDGQRFKYMLPAADEFADLMRTAGVDRGSAIVIASAGMNASDLSQAARLYWQLKYFGHDAVAVLDGGTAQWLLEERPASREPSPELNGDWQPGPGRSALLAGSAAVAAAGEQGGTALVDNRPLAQYLGVEKRRYVRSKGHIPGAMSVPVELLVSEGVPARFRAVDELAGLHKAMGIDPAAPAITYCNSGHLAAGGWFVLHELLGNDNARLYDGSMHQWAVEKRPATVRWRD